MGYSLGFPLILNLLKDVLPSVAEGSEMPALATVLPCRPPSFPPSTYTVLPASLTVIPTKVGIPRRIDKYAASLGITVRDSRLRGNDGGDNRYDGRGRSQSKATLGIT